jgi:hypothetical protein
MVVVRTLARLLDCEMASIGDERMLPEAIFLW